MCIRDRTKAGNDHEFWRSFARRRRCVCACCRLHLRHAAVTGRPLLLSLIHISEPTRLALI
eukprot:9197313-Alexandrium_andersonii.AAC.1